MAARLLGAGPALLLVVVLVLVRGARLLGPQPHLLGRRDLRLRQPVVGGPLALLREPTGARAGRRAGAPGTAPTSPGRARAGTATPPALARVRLAPGREARPRAACTWRRRPRGPHRPESQDLRPGDCATRASVDPAHGAGRPGHALAATRDAGADAGPRRAATTVPTRRGRSPHRHAEAHGRRPRDRQRLEPSRQGAASTGAPGVVPARSRAAASSSRPRAARRRPRRRVLPPPRPKAPALDGARARENDRRGRPSLNGA